MQKILVDSSVWIDYFKNGDSASRLEEYIVKNNIYTNQVILLELIPIPRLKNQKKVIALLDKIKKKTLFIDWKELTSLQSNCLKHGMNGIGIPDLIVAQNTVQNDCLLFTLDHHFSLIKNVYPLEIVES